MIGHGTGASAGLISNLSEVGQPSSSHLDSMSRLVALSPCIVRNPLYNLFPGDLDSVKAIYLFVEYFFPDVAFLDVIDQAYYDYIDNTAFPGASGEEITVPGVNFPVSDHIFNGIKGLILEAITDYLTLS